MGAPKSRRIRIEREADVTDQVVFLIFAVLVTRALEVVDWPDVFDRAEGVRLPDGSRVAFGNFYEGSPVTRKIIDICHERASALMRAITSPKEN